MANSIYEHFHPDEHDFVDKASEWVDRAIRNHEQRLTDFLDPRQQFILKSVAGREPDVQVAFDGGYPDAERVRAILAPDYAYLEDVDYDIQVLSITSEDAKFPSLEHGDFLGAVLGLGIKRDKIGDIHVHGGACHILVAGKMSEYVHLQMQYVHKAKVMTELQPLSALKVAETKLEEMGFTVASMRLDGILSDVVRLSRAKVLQPIKAGRCRVNWKVVEDPSASLKQGDVVSFQGFGRFKVLEVDGVTKSGRIRIRVGRYV